MKIIFMGTPDFAVPALQKLIDNKNFKIKAIYTKEPKIAGRGHKIQNSPIHNLALKYNLNVITPKSLKDQKIQQEFTNFKADVAVVVAFGILLPPEILKATKFGCLNIHPSLLPKWRGAAPIQRTLMAGDKETGVNIIQMNENLDQGDILATELIKLDNDITYQELAPKLAEIGANLMIKTLEDLPKNKIKNIKQDDEKAIYAKKISKEEFLINWNLKAKEVNNQIRGLSGCGSAYFELGNEKIKIHQAEIISEESHNFIAGEIIDDKLTIACKSGLIRPKILQKAGKNKMSLEEFLKGNLVKQLENKNYIDTISTKK